MKKIIVAVLVAMVALPLPLVQGQPAPDSPAVDVPQPVQGNAAAPTDLSPAVTEVLRLADSGVGDDVIASYIQNSKSPFQLTADHILYLKDLGVSNETITAMLNHDKGLPVASDAPVAPSVPQSTPPPVREAPTVTAPLVPAEAPTYVSNPPADATYFYNDLSPYGTWISLEGYGWCWQPRAVVINRAWRPYCEGGHWIFTDAGWYWQSDYSWGWAPFHYGRWYLHNRCGWVWLPDRVWGPAWVVWRSYGDHCGWAPVPPHATFDAAFGWRFNGVSVGVNFDFGLHPDHFTFIAVKDFNHHDYGHYRVARSEVTRIYNHTTIINNYTVENKTIVNRGIPVDRVASATRTEVRKVTIRDVPAGAGRTAVTRTSDRNGVVYRPELRAPTRPVRITAQKVDERHPVIQHNEIATAPVQRRTERPAQPSNDRPSSYRLGRPTSNSEKQTRPPTPTHEPERNLDKAPQREPQTDSRKAPQADSRRAVPAVTAPAAPSAQSTPQAYPGNRASGPASVPPGQVRQAEVQARQQDTRGANPHIYYPKSYRQAAAIRGLPPERPQKSERSQGNGPDNQDKSNSHSKKHDD